MGSTIFKRHILKPVFGAQWKTALIEGKFARYGGTQKYRMEWTSFNLPLVEEYGAQHRIFKKPGIRTVCYPHPNVPPGENIIDPQPDEECLVTELDSDSSEEEEEAVVYVNKEHANSQSVAGGMRIWYSNPALDGRDPKPMQDIITLALRLPDFHPVNKSTSCFL